MVIADRSCVIEPDGLVGVDCAEDGWMGGACESVVLDSGVTVCAAHDSKVRGKGDRSDNRVLGPRPRSGRVELGVLWLLLNTLGYKDLD